MSINNPKQYMYIVIAEQWYKVEYWVDNNYYVGRLIDKPSIMSQGMTVGQLESNIRDAYAVMMEA